MEAPHISGIVALLKSLHPHWSPAAIKSALVTTAWQTDPHSGEPIIAKGNTDRIADPFDFGGGLVNANGANDPGLVYDMGESDYVICALWTIALVPSVESLTDLLLVQTKCLRFLISIFLL